MTTTQRWTLAVVSAATAILILDIAVVNTALSHIAEDLETGLSGLQWVVDAYTLAIAATVLTAGALADRLGRRRVFSVGVVVFTLSSLAATFAPTIHVLNGARAVQGIGAAVMFAVSLALLAHAFPGRVERTKALALYGATIGASFTIGPALGGVLTSGVGWRAIFLVNVPIGIGVLLATRHAVKESRDPAARRIDWAGQVTLTGGLFLLVLALLRGNEDGWSSAVILAELAAAAGFLAAFVAVERRATDPMLPLGLFRLRMFTGAQVAVLAISASFFAVFLYMTLYLQEIVGLSPVEAGLAYMPATVVSFFVSAGTANLGQRVAPGKIVAVGLALVAAGLGLMTLTEVGSSWTVILPGSIVGMIGAGLFNPAISGVALGALPDEQSGLAAGVNDTFRQTGVAVGVAALGALVPAQAALGGGSPAEYVDGLHAALLVGAALAAAGAAVAAVLLRQGARRAPVALAGPAPLPAAEPV